MSPLTEIPTAIVAKLRATNPTIKPKKINRAWEIVVKSESDLLNFVPPDQGKAIWVVVFTKIFTERADRLYDRHGYTVFVLALDRVDRENNHLLNPNNYEALDLWADARVDWVDQNIYKPLAATTFAPVEGAIIEPGGARIDEVLDPSFLRTHGIFWSESSFTYTLDEANH